jgi:ketosteroid isomerase-like protein
MSQQDVEKVRAAYEAFGNGDLEGAAKDMADDLEWWSSEEIPEGGTIRGKAEVVASWSRIPDYYSDFAVAPTEFMDAGDKVVVVGTQRGTGKDTGKSFETRYAHVFWMRDGQVVRSEFHSDSAKEAAALSA